MAEGLTDKRVVKARFVRKGTGAPVTGNQYTARLYDRDLFNDDYLGKSPLDANGNVVFHFTAKDYGWENRPDLYILLFDEDTVHFETKIFADTDFEVQGTLDASEGEIVDLGVFEVE